MTDDTETQPATEVTPIEPGQPSGDVQAEEGLPKEGATSVETETEQTDQESEEEEARRLTRNQRRQRKYHETQAANLRLMEEKQRW